MGFPKWHCKQRILSIFFIGSILMSWGCQTASVFAEALITGPHASPSSVEFSRLSFSSETQKKEGDWRALTTQTLYLNAIFIGINGVLWFLPESFSKWSEEDKQDLLGSWSANVKEGPVQDEDNFFFNWITHPYAGAAYYMMAKKTGFSWQKSCLYSAAVSTFMWEYGWEAFIEIPSTNDLWVTPVLGCPLGELFYRWDRSILRNKGEVLQSRVLGSVVRFSLDPLGRATRFLQKSFGGGDLEIKLAANRQQNAFDKENSTLGWRIILHF